MDSRESRDTTRAVLAKADAESSSAFGTALFSELCTELPPEDNVLVSPLSVYQALALAKAGATRGSPNEAEMNQLLGNQTVQDHALMLQKQAENIDPTSDVQLSMATSLWANQIRQSYNITAQKVFSAEAFDLPETYSEVDDWVEEKTNGMITRLMGDARLDPLTVALLVNAVHFRGAWTYEFDPDRTLNSTFHLDDETEVDARYMTAHREMDVIVDSPSPGGASAVILDYGKQGPDRDPEFSSIFILPESSGVDSMNATISGLNSQPISDLLLEAKSIDVKLRLPRFRFESGPVKLRPSLERMGMTAAFNEDIPNKFLEMNSDPWL